MVNSDGWCFSHDPDITDEQRTEVRRRGGINSSAIARLSAHLPTELANIVDTLADTIVGVRTGAVPPNVGNSVASLCRAVVAAHLAASDETRLEQFDRTLSRLETAIDKARGDTNLRAV